MSKNIAYDKNGNILPKMAKLKIVTIAISDKLYTHNHNTTISICPFLVRYYHFCHFYLSIFGNILPFLVCTFWQHLTKNDTVIIKPIIINKP